MLPDIFTYPIDSGQLPGCRDEILELTGYSPENGDLYIPETVDKLLATAAQYMDIRCGYRRVFSEDVKINQENIHCLGSVFECGSTITAQLQGSDGLALFAVTLGQVFDDWLRELFSEGDPFSGYLADLIGSVRTEQAADWLENQITKQVNPEGLQTSNRFSPGYCGWDVAEQHRLFGLLPTNFLNIQLNESALMSPIKSVSGLIGIGENVKKASYTCKFCNMENCFMRRINPRNQKRNLYDR